MRISNQKKSSAINFRRVGRGSVVLIAGLLVSSAMIRLVSGVALAEDFLAKPLPASEQRDSQYAIRNMTDRTQMGSLLEALLTREKRVAERERQIDLRSHALEAADEEIGARMTALKEAEAALRATLSLADGAAEGDLARLTTVYESMKPKDAAALFETMEPAFAAGFLGRMRPDIAANVMAGLSPKLAYSISVILASRNANVPKT